MIKTYISPLLLLLVFALVPVMPGCPQGDTRNLQQDGLPVAMSDYEKQRSHMIETQLVSRGIKNPRVLAAFRAVGRHRFVPERFRAYSYEDRPLPIGEGQTISQPYIVAFMTEVLNLKDTDTVLEIGTGSGYQAAILAELCQHVYTIEILPSLGRTARQVLSDLGYTNISVKIGDGYKGWPEYAPFDAIIVTCAPTRIPEALQDQLAEGGRMIIPVGEAYGQELVLLTKKNGRIIQTAVLPVMFVPMVDQKGKTY